jgi:hypothetical protein
MGENTEKSRAGGSVPGKTTCDTSLTGDSKSFLSPGSFGHPLVQLFSMQNSLEGQPVSRSLYD